MVVAVGLTLVEPLTEVDVNVPGVMAILVAPLVAQLSILLEPEFMLSGSAENEVIVGAEPFPGGGIDEIAELQSASPAQANRMRTCALRSRPKDLRSGELGLLLQEELVEPIEVTLQLWTSASNRNFRFALPAVNHYTSNRPHGSVPYSSSQGKDPGMPGRSFARTKTKIFSIHRSEGVFEQSVRSRPFYAPDFFSILAQESLSARVRLKTRLPGVESGSRQK